MKRYTKLFAAVLTALMLAGCSTAKQPSETKPSPSESQPPVQTTQATEPSTEPTQPPTTIPTEPPLKLEAGPKVFVNGVRITDTAMEDGTIYISASLYCEALGGSAAADGSVSLHYGGVFYTFSEAYEHMLIDGKAVIPEHPVLAYQDEAYVPLEELCAMMELAVLHDPEANAVYCTAAAWPRAVPGGYDVPVFMYHAVDNDLWGIAELFVKPEMMEQQLKYLSDNGYDTIFFEDLYHIENYDKPVILTFDDGYLDNYAQLFPLLKKYNCKATVFVIDKYIGKDVHYLNMEQIREMADSGLVSIQSHTVNHPNLDELSLEEQRQELERSKVLTARLSLRVPYVLCYPSGRFNNDTLSIIDESYQFGIKMNGGLYNTSDDPYLVARYYVARGDSLYWFTSTLEGIFG